MNTKTSRKSVSPEQSGPRLAVARTFHDAARKLVEAGDAGGQGNAIVSNIVLAAIAYADALTIAKGSVVNVQDHATAPRLLREVLKDNLPTAQEARFKKLLGWKDQAQYGSRGVTLADARRLADDLERFAEWAESLLG